MYKAALDVHYRHDSAKAVCLLFKEWQDANPVAVFTEEIKNVAPYQPGLFYKRELPCLLAVLQKVETGRIELLIVDGYVYINDDNTYGLGGHLYEALRKSIPVIGVAKTRFYSNAQNVIALKRGPGKNPLYISAIGMETKTAADYIQNMAGKYRIPTLLRQLDKITKQ